MPARSRLARLQQLLVLATVGAALGWLLAWWPRAPGVAVLGALALLAVHAGVLALEFACLPFVGRTDPAPRARLRELLRAWAAETLQGWRVFAWRQPFRWRQLPDQPAVPSGLGRHGVVFIHGFVCNRGFWLPWLTRLRREGRSYVAINLEPVFTSIDDYVPLVEAAVEAVRAGTGRPPVLVCHSMGGLVARAWLRTRHDARPVAHVVTIGSPHSGTWLARFSRLANGRQMRQGNEWLDALLRAATARPDDPFTCWYSNCDNIVFPPSTATLARADNRLVRGAAHVELAFRAEVMEATLALVDSLDGGK